MAGLMERRAQPAYARVALCLLPLAALFLVLAAVDRAGSTYNGHHDDIEGMRFLADEPIALPGQSHHKKLLPLDAWDKAGIFAAIIGLMIAAGGGIGGGGILVPIFVLIMRFHPKYAIPLSNITIFGGAITNVALNLSKRHPLADRPLVDWDLILVMEPLTIGGALVGSFINKVLPEEILALSLVILLTLTAHRTLKKGASMYAKETRAMAQQAKAGKMSELTTLHEAQAEELVEEEGVSLLPKGRAAEDSTAAHLPTGDYVEGGYDDNEHASMAEEEARRTHLQLQKLLEEERLTPRRKVAILSGVFVVVLAVNILKGGGAFPSPLGIRCGSFMFWGASVFILVWVTGTSLWVRDMLVAQWRLKTKCGYRYVEGDVQWSPSATIKYPSLCFFAGFCAGLFGVGGGIVKGPLMLEMGVHPKVASATSACMILFTSFTATTSFMVFGLLRRDYAQLMFVVGLLATFVGQVGVNYLVQRYQRSSLIIVSIGAVVALSALLMGGQSLYFLAFPRQDDESGGFCAAGE
eukprot:TRINITY_DN21199_c0_g1_i1.p1 TRINITY_DN21199_c0_g1~~TRINITY_DN21199_c0_g1_i1.p1  ORF type:complete len:524 (+),score=113.26 TRINITY_DN21199_c0_g1_i1:90-1661(+)